MRRGNRPNMSRRDRPTVCPGCPKGWCKGCVPVILTDADKAQMKAEKQEKNVSTD